MAEAPDLLAGLASALARAGIGAPDALDRLSGGATMESWRFEADGRAFVLRRAPSLAFMQGRPFGHADEAAIIRTAHAAGVTAPEVIVVLEPSDGIGSGYVMRALPGTADPRAILAMPAPDRLLAEAARDLARIHAIPRADLPSGIPEMDYAEAVESLAAQFAEAGGDRPVIALGLRWLRDNLPEPVPPVLNHGDYRLGNLLAEDGWLTGVLDWELAHLGDRHEDLAFGCMAVWRFARYDRPALGLGSLENWFAAYETESGARVDRERFRFWLVYRTVWWALGCLRNARFWRSGEDRMLERVVISRRTSEQELDLLMLLEDELTSTCATRDLPFRRDATWPDDTGEANIGELAVAVSEWLGSIKDKLEGHDRFQLAVARNALGIIAREGRSQVDVYNDDLADFILGRPASETLEDEACIRELQHLAMWKVQSDSPKYPALRAACQKWIGEN